MLNHTSATYQGDETLNALLKGAGLDLDATTIRALLSGVITAPAGEHPNAWLELVGDPQGQEGTLKGELLALHAHLKAEQADIQAKEPGLNQRLSALRARLADEGVCGFLVPRADEHQGEYVPLSSERLRWLTGFTGSAGLAVVLTQRAVLFADGRYTIQAQQQVNLDKYEVCNPGNQGIHTWLKEALSKGDILGFDPRLHTLANVRSLRRALKEVGATLRPLSINPLDATWEHQPAPPISPVFPHPIRFSGKQSADKIAEVSTLLLKQKIDAQILSAPDSIAWLLNIRGGDVPFTPLALSFAIIQPNQNTTLFIDTRKLTPAATDHLKGVATVAPPPALKGHLQTLGAQNLRVQLDQGTASFELCEILKEAGAEISLKADPCTKMKSQKNKVEQNGTRAAHLRDGIALTRFLHWLEQHCHDGKITEIKASNQLARFRREGEHFRDHSFPSISGSGPNGAIVHYRATPKSDRKLALNSLYLIDSGAQYLDGTTDVTRTVAIGEPTDEMRRHFTLVLEGHVELARAIFPDGTSGGQLDALARGPLWRAGLDFDHGTGHGVGSYLSVHEGPQRIGKSRSNAPLRSGMIVSNEPGFYLEGQYGIRIENLVLTTPAPKRGLRPMLCFETLTLAPIDRRLIDVSMLPQTTRDWINQYHAEVYTKLAENLPPEVASWLAGVTQAL